MSFCVQDSAEQNMFSFAANMYLTLYMRLINQRNRTQEHDAFYHMNILYQRQLSFMKPDGSFSLFRSDWYGLSHHHLNPHIFTAQKSSIPKNIENVNLVAGSTGLTK